MGVLYLNARDARTAAGARFSRRAFVKPGFSAAALELQSYRAPQRGLLDSPP
jgi:hypothetical protein